MDEWGFYQHTDSRWSWRNVRTDGTSQSVERFATFLAVTADAAQHGFTPGSSKIAAVQAAPRSPTSK